MNSLAALQTLNLANDVRVDALQDGPSPWNFLVPNRNVLYYTFDASPGSEIDIETDTFHVAFNTTQKSAARSILTHVGQLIGVTFTEVTTSNQADFHFAATNLYGVSNVSGLSSTYYSYSYLGDEIRSLTAESLIWLDNADFAAENNNPVAGSQGYETLLHEIGHAVGLGHPFEATAASPYNLPVAQDNTNNTVMSYTDAGDWKTTFQSYDVLALTWIYGGDGLGGTWGYNSIQGNSLTPIAADVTPPGLSLSSPVPGAVGVALGSNIVLTFNESVQRGTGNLVLKTATGTVVEVFNIATNTTNLSLSGNLLTVNPTVNLNASTGYVLEVAAGALVDFAGNAFAGTSLGFTTMSHVNAPPTGSVLIGGAAIEGQTLTVTNSLADADGLGAISYQWKANGTPIGGATGVSYTLTQAEVGKTITVTASYVDGYGTPESWTSAATSAVADSSAPPALSKNDDYVVLQYASPAIVGAGVGNDIYLISGYMLPAGAKITISDTLGSNSLQLAPSLSLASFKVAVSSLQLTLDTGAVITVLGANGFTYDVGGMTPAGIDNPDISYADFVRDTLGVTMPSGSGIVSGGALVLGVSMAVE